MKKIDSYSSLIRKSYVYIEKGLKREGERVMGVVIGRMDGQVEKIFLGNNLTRSTKNYAKILKDENLSDEEKQRILAAEKKKQEDDIIL